MNDFVKKKLGELAEPFNLVVFEAIPENKKGDPEYFQELLDQFKMLLHTEHELSGLNSVALPFDFEGDFFSPQEVLKIDVWKDHKHIQNVDFDSIQELGGSLFSAGEGEQLSFEFGKRMLNGWVNGTIDSIVAFIRYALLDSQSLSLTQQWAAFLQEYIEGIVENRRSTLVQLIPTSHAKVALALIPAIEENIPAQQLKETKWHFENAAKKMS